MTRSRAPIVAILPRLLALLYVGTYLALVVPEGRSGTKTVYEDGKQGTVLYFTSYRLGTRAEQWGFWPLEQIDRRVRPGAWEMLITESGGVDRRKEQP